MKIKIVGNYRCRDIVFEKGQTIELPEAEAKLLIADAPGCFKVLDSIEPDNTEEEAKEVDEAPVDKMIHKAKTK